MILAFSKDMQHSSPEDARQYFRKGNIRSSTAMADGFIQTNLAIMPKEYAYDFLNFCFKNPKPCPLIDVTEPGSFSPSVAPTADLRTDVAKYRVYREGKYEKEVQSLEELWSPDLVTFLMGCSFTFEMALLHAGIPVRNIEQGTIVPMYTSNIQCASSGRFFGPTVVTMRPIPYQSVSRAVQITSRYPGVHGAPIHVGAPEYINVDLSKPEFGGEISEIRQGETPVFWACGVTPQAVALASKIPFLITHAPGHMFITDMLNESVAVL